jgi:hypothetical protein
VLEVRVVWADEEHSMEERRAQLPKYAAHRAAAQPGAAAAAGAGVPGAAVGGGAPAAAVHTPHAGLVQHA